MNTLLIIDGNAILYRAFYALPAFKTKNGTPTNAIYGFFSMLLKSIEDFKPTHISVCFDTPVPTFRKKMYLQYQAHRPKIADEFKVQIPIVKEMLDKAGINRMEKEGYEADDVIGTIAKKYRLKDMKVLILTGDRDIFQLIDQNIFVITPQVGITTTKIYDSDQVMQKYGINPSQIADYKGLMGDNSDNYKGAKGIGPKTATQLLKQYVSIEEIFKNIDRLENKRIQEILKKEKENIMTSKILASIICDVPLDLQIDQTKFEKFQPELKTYLQTLEMHSLIKRLFAKKENHKKPLKNNDQNNQMNLF